MARTDTLGNFLTDIANAIREQLNIEDKITIDQYVDYILQIQTPYHEIGE